MTQASTSAHHENHGRTSGARRAPRSTYRLQLQPAFGFDDAAAVVDLLDALGVSHAYLSPILQAVPGSTHGYDVIDHSRLGDELGGRAGFDRLVAALHERGLGAVADVVPNHMAVPTPASLNRALWSVLREGPRSPYARWFDVDWAAQDRAVLMPVLGRRIGQCLADGEITVDTSGAEPLVRYYDHVLPVREGTEDLPVAELLDRQFYRLAHWRVADEELNYRRFFDIDTLAGLRVEHEEVFAESHEQLTGLVRSGALDGLRIDHPDGLADPRQYLRRLADATDGTWVVVEKILEGAERLPADWVTAGTTGYDALLRVGGLFLDPDGAEPLTDLYTELTEAPGDFADVVEQAKRFVVDDVLATEITRLVDLLAGICHDDIDLRDHTRRGLHDALVEMLVAFPVYRAYVVPGEPAPEQSVQIVAGAAAVAAAVLPEERHDTIMVVRDLALGRLGFDRPNPDPRRAEFVTRFQQTCGPVMAKGVEDTAFYRWFRLSSLNEVGGDPAHFGVSPAEFHATCAARQRDLPLSMTTLTTHDTKRNEDVRARLAVLSEVPEEWHQAVVSWRAAAAAYHSAAGPDANTEYLMWQTLVGAWPLDAQRLTGYLKKATREAKQHTSWTAPDEDYDAAVRSFAEQVLADELLCSGVSAFVDKLAPHTRANVLGQKLVQLTMPGVPDVYQGTELVSLSLVDPDNRRPVDYALRRDLLARLDADERPGKIDIGDRASTLDAEKLLVTSRALRLRREHPEWFGRDGAYVPLQTSTEHAVGFARADAVATVVSRLTVGLDRAGGWGSATVIVPDGQWRDLLGGASYAGGPVRCADLLSELPVALLVHR
jgi:(1->4)-alpha-D-glucan 1-alpha-D-glucosylmutase